MSDIRAALAAEPVGEGPILQWTENMPPSEDCRYDHCTAETPFGRFLISWKSWKQFDSPTVDETPWGDWYGAFNSVDAAKAACQKEMDDRIACWVRPAAPFEAMLQQQSAPAPVVVPVAVAERLPGEGDLDVEGKCWWCTRLEDGRAVWILKPQLLVPALAAVAIPRRTHWLPAHAIPLPQVGEGEAQVND